jgi:rSAM/selenodomain-associated transferase 2
VAVSIIVPIINEAEIIREFLEHLRLAAGSAEIIVVDGGSTDGTPELCDGLADKLLKTDRGRARQLNFGSETAAGDIFWFVHADSRISPDSVRLIEQTLADPSVVGGCFRLQIIPRRWVYRIRDTIGNFCVTLFQVALGDRGLFCRRDSFFAVGGYPDQPLLEDADFYRKLRRFGRVQQVAATIQTSGRRYEALGPIRTSLFYLLVMMLYAMGVKISHLERIVSWFSATARINKNRRSRRGVLMPSGDASD